MENISYYFSNISIITYLVVFAAGVATSFTPCIYPLLPIVVGVIGTSKEKSKWKNFILSLSYVLGMALTFSILGLTAALSGRIFGQLQSSALAQIIVGAIIILFGLVLLEVIPLPTALLYKLSTGQARRVSSLPAVFLLGAVSGFIASPCTAAILGALLTYVATSRNLVFGSTLLFTFALGLGTVLLLIGTFSGILTSLPKLEKRMHIIQKVIAWAMILWGGYFILKAWLLTI